MTHIKVEKKIVGYEVEVGTAEEAVQAEPAVLEVSEPEDAKVIRMHEKLERPDMLIGSTYKVKTPVSDHSMYVTINDIV